MGEHDEHDDDLEPEVIEGEEIETEKYEPAEDEDLVPGSDETTLPDRTRRKPPHAEPDESDDEAADTI